MRKFVGATALLLFVCSLSVSALYAVDDRILGTWKLQSERILNGSAPTSLVPGTVMTIQQDTSSRSHAQSGPAPLVILLFSESGSRLHPSPEGVSTVVQWTVTPDGNSMTETISSTELRTHYRVARVWRRQ